jgi:hypothetical protein
MLNWLQDSQTQAAGKTIVAGILGAAGMFGVLTATQQGELINAWGDIQGGAVQMAKGLSVVLGIIGPPLLAWWAHRKASPENQKAAVAVMPNTMVVSLPAAATPEADHNAKVAASAQIATIPAVANVISTPAVADATESSKIIDSAHDTTTTG